MPSEFASAFAQDRLPTFSGPDPLGMIEEACSHFLARQASEFGSARMIF